MRNGIVVAILLIGVVLAIAAEGTGVFAQTVGTLFDPNGDNTPTEIKNLKLSFQINSQDAIAPIILLTADGSKGFANYVVSATANQGYVLVFKPSETDPTKQFIKAIPVGQRPALMYFNPAKTEIWVVNLGRLGINPNVNCSISIIDVNSLQVAATIALPSALFGMGSNVLFSQGGDTAYIASTLTDDILKIDTVKRELTQTLHLTSSNPYYYFSVGPANLVLSHDGSFICCTNTFDQTVSIINTATFTLRHQVVFVNPNAASGSYVPNFCYRNNVLLNENDTVGFIASIGTGSIGINDENYIYLFDPATGQKLKNSSNVDRTLDLGSSTASPSSISIDPSGQLLVVQISSFDKVSTSYGYAYGFPNIILFKWPTLEFYKRLEFKNPEYNMSRSTSIAYARNSDGTYDILFPSFSSYAAGTAGARDSIIRVPVRLWESCTSIDTSGDPDNRVLPITLTQFPTTDNLYMVANYLSGTLAVAAAPEKSVYSIFPSVCIGTGSFAAVALLNPYDQPVTYTFQSIQTDDTSVTTDDDNAGKPFYYTTTDGTTTTVYLIDPIDLTLNPGQLYTAMFQDLNPSYAKVSNQHGYTQVVHSSLPINGVVFNGAADSTGNIIKGTYLKINHPMYQECIFPFLYGSSTVRTFYHLYNPFWNQVRLLPYSYNSDGTTASGWDSTFTMGARNGTDILTSVESAGFIRVIDVDNLLAYAYMTVESIDTDAPFYFACPPLDPYQLTKNKSFYIPYFAVGNGFETSLNLVSNYARYDSSIVDSNNNQIPQSTHVKLDFYDPNGTYTKTLEYDFLNQSQFLIELSSSACLNLDRYADAITTGSVVVTVNQDYVCGVYSYSQWNKPTETITNPLKLIRNIAADELPLDSDASSSFTFPFATTVLPFYTAYALYNPGTVPVTARVEIYRPDGTMLGQSAHDLTVPSHGNVVFYLGDPSVFGTIGGLDSFTGYVKILSPSGGSFIAKSIQGSPNIMTIVPAI